MAPLWFLSEDPAKKGDVLDPPEAGPVPVIEAVTHINDHSSFNSGTIEMDLAGLSAVAGDLLVAHLSVRMGSAQTTEQIETPDGWTSVEDIEMIGVGSSASRLIYKSATGSDPNEFFTTTPSNWGGSVCFRISGADLASPIDDSNLTVITSSGSSGAALTAAAANRLLLMLASSSEGAGVMSFGDTLDTSPDDYFAHNHTTGSNHAHAESSEPIPSAGSIGTRALFGTMSSSFPTSLILALIKPE